MTSDPMIGEPSSHLQLAKCEPETPKSLQADVTIEDFSTSPAAPFTPLPSLPGKRKRLKPVRLIIPSTKAEKKHSTSKYKAVRDPSTTSLRFRNKKILTPEEMTPTMIRAKEFQSTLGNESPSFMKTMVRSHVTSCFWMGLPMPFAKSYLPNIDCSMIAEDENGEKCIIKYIAYRFGFSGGWKAFAVAHKLHEGDVLVFQLVESCKFKVYILRVNDSKEVDGALNLTTQNFHEDQLTPAFLKAYSKSKGRKPSLASSLPLKKVQKKRKQSEPPIQLSSHPVENSPVNSEVQGPNLSIQKDRTFKDFHIMVNNQCIDSELSEEIRTDYHNLCTLKNEILHDSIQDGLYFKLVAGMIGETVSIANAIKNCKITTTKEEFDVWDSSLKYFELKGMKVGFLRDRISLLAKFACEYGDAKKYVEAKEEQNRNEKEIRVLERKLVELYENDRKINVVLEGLKEKAESYEIEFRKKVDAPL